MLSLYDVRNIGVSDIEKTQFDIGLFASGFDARASFLARKIDPGSIDNKLILGFSEWKDSKYRKVNNLFYKEQYAEPVILSSSNDREIYCELNKIFEILKNKEELKILLDYTSMSRLWYSGILNYVKLQNHNKIEVYINYCPGNYINKIHDFGYSAINSLPGHEGVLTSNDRTTLVVPVGFYSDIVRAIIQEIEPNEIVGILGIPSIKKEYEERTYATKEDLGGDIKKWLNCPVNDLETIFRTYSEIINNSAHHEIMLLPLGPKTFNMASILVSQRFEHITCLYLKTKSNEENSVEATGDCVCNKITYCRMRSGYIRPSLRWPGNKYSLLKEIVPRFPSSFNNYHEPFLGSASVFLNTQCQQDIYLSDINEDLINFYLQIRDNLNAFIEITHRKVNLKSYYDVEKNTIYNTLIEKACQFYYLNRTCFNGIYRVNSSGKFNVPYGYRENLKIVDESSLSILHDKLINANIIHCDFYNSLKYIKPNDFVFLDPPYSAKKQSNKFNMYNDRLFLWSDQLRLKDYCIKLNEVGAKFMLTNLYDDDIYQLFAKDLGLNYFFTERYTSIGSNVNSRGKYNEYVFCNYELQKNKDLFGEEY